MDTTAAALRPTILVPRGRRIAAAALLVAAVSMPLTGTGTALGATHAPAQAKVAALADSVAAVVSTGKNDI
jgi:hypothetical protein